MKGFGKGVPRKKEKEKAFFFLSVFIFIILVKLGIKRERLGWRNEFALHVNGFAVEEREREREREREKGICFGWN